MDLAKKSIIWVAVLFKKSESIVKREREREIERERNYRMKGFNLQLALASRHKTFLVRKRCVFHSNHKNILLRNSSAVVFLFLCAK